MAVLALTAVMGTGIIGTGVARADPVTVDGGRLAGTQVGGLRQYKAIPFAAPPVGPLRWRPPQPVRPWRGIRSAKDFAPACPQPGRYPPDAPPQATDEDCLTLNVWAPVTGPREKLPVMVWIHGGGLTNGSGSIPQYDGERLARRGVIVVTLNYRLGSLGFLVHPDLNRESADGVSGNYGLLDQIAALKWVRRNIGRFGGDPDRVTIFGQSSGSFSASMLTVAPMAKGLFQRVIGESGAVFEPVELDPLFTPEGAAEAGAAFARKAGARTISDLRRLPVAALLKLRFNPQFNIDGHVLPAAPRDVYAAGRQHTVDLLVGTNAAEGSYFLDPAEVRTDNFNAVLARTYPSLLLKAIGASPGMSDAEARRAAIAIDSDLRFRWGMWAWAGHMANAHDRRTYFYRFAGEPAYRPGHPFHGLGATHGAELPYVFGNLDPRAASWTPADRQLSDSIQRYWTNFARTGDPNGPGLAPWPKFDSDHAVVLNLGPAVTAAPIGDRARLMRIDRVYATAAFVSRHRYALLATGLIVALGLLAGLILIVRRCWRKRAARRLRA